jgi:hypothetical protein
MQEFEKQRERLILSDFASNLFAPFVRSIMLLINDGDIKDLRKHVKTKVDMDPTDEEILQAGSLELNATLTC